MLLYDNRHQKFPGKLHTRWMGPYRVTRIFENGSLQLADLQGNSFETRVNGSRVKNYNPEDVHRHRRKRRPGRGGRRIVFAGTLTFENGVMWDPRNSE